MLTLIYANEFLICIQAFHCLLLNKHARFHGISRKICIQSTHERNRRTKKHKEMECIRWDDMPFAVEVTKRMEVSDSFAFRMEMWVNVIERPTDFFSFGSFKENHYIRKKGDGAICSLITPIIAYTCFNSIEIWWICCARNLFSFFNFINAFWCASRRDCIHRLMAFLFTDWNIKSRCNVENQRQRRRQQQRVCNWMQSFTKWR